MHATVNTPRAEDISRLQECQQRLAEIKEQVAELQFPTADKCHSIDINTLAILMNSLKEEFVSAAPNERPMRIAEALLLLAKCGYFSDPPGPTSSEAT